MFEHLDDPLPPEPGDQARRAVASRSRQIVQRRRTLQAGTAVVVLLAAAIPSVAALSGGGTHQTVRTVARPSSSTSEEPTTSEAATAPTTAVPALVTTAAPTTTTTTLRCRNSTSPKCGPFSWDPQPPPNQPLTVDVTHVPTAPVAGDTVVFKVTFNDPDAPEVMNDCPTFGDETGTPCPYWASVVLAGPSRPCPRYGPWTPPVPSPGHKELTFSHLYRAPGMYGFSISGYSATPGFDDLKALENCFDPKTHREGFPFSSPILKNFMLTVGPAPTTTTSGQ